MSATNHTSTIELSQYISTDKPTYLTDYNGDMLKIDNAIAADRDSIATAQGTANTADGKADINKTSIDSLNVQLNGDPDDPTDIGIAGDLNAVEGTVNTITSLIGTGSPTTSEQTIIGAINGLEGAIAPREDGTTLVNSYEDGDQFARGGSLYEALTALTAGTAFSSLVLNTDYKLSGTLVQQIKNGINLPDGYYIKSTGIKAEVTGDGVNNLATILGELASEFLTELQALADDEIAIVREVEVPGFHAMFLRPQLLQYLTNAATSYSCGFNSTSLTATAISTHYVTIKTSGTCVAVWASIDSSTVTFSDSGSSNVPSATSKFHIVYDVYKKF